ncbi:MAG: FapA family protein [Spirochaetales bacterium]|nr:FapA family protein [Spirochaetales bacterium]
MVSVEDFREYMKDQLRIDRERKSVQVVGSSIDDALLSATVELGLPKHRLEYEVLDPGSKGFFGVGKRDCILIVYQRETGKSSILGDINGDDFGLNDDILVNEDGYFTINLTDEGAFLLVHDPVGTGNKVNSSDVLETLITRGVENYDKNQVIEIVEKSKGEFVKIGTFEHLSANDASLDITISDDEMVVEMYVIAPGYGGMNLSVEKIMEALEVGGVEFGIRIDNIEDFIKKPVYNENYVIAEGQPVKNGEDSKLIYSFKQTGDIDLKQDKDGRINFKELNRFTNVVEGQPLATIKPPGVGVDGKTVFGRYIPATDGKVVEVKLGKNVSIVNDKTVVADVSGQVLLINGKITVETILVIDGDVNVETGNINSLGSVVIEGNVEDGFTVNAQANIEVNGYVGKSTLTSGGDIIVKQGINGGSGTEISAGGSVWSSFITNSKVESGDRVIVSDGIVNSHVDAAKKILCKGKRAKIVGGHLRAAQEINAAVIGTSGGTETLVEVGFDPKTKAEIEDLTSQLKIVTNRLDEVNKNLHSLVRIKKQNSELSEEKENFLKQLKSEHNKLTNQKRNLTDELSDKSVYLSSLSSEGIVGASKEVFPGVVIMVEDKTYEVKNLYKKSVSFVLDPEGFIITKDYVEIQEDIERRSINVNKTS